MSISPLASFLPILIFAMILLILLRVVSLRSTNPLMRGMLLVSVSLLIGYSSVLYESEAVAAGAFWLSLAVAVAGTLYLIAGIRSNPGGDSVLLFASSLLLILFSAYAYASIWIASNLAQAACQPYPGTITCTPPDYNYLLLLTSLWMLPGVITVINTSYFMRKSQKEKARLLDLRMREAARRREQAKREESSSSTRT